MVVVGPNTFIFQKEGCVQCTYCMCVVLHFSYLALFFSQCARCNTGRKHCAQRLLFQPYDRMLNLTDTFKSKIKCECMAIRSPIADWGIPFGSIERSIAHRMTFARVCCLDTQEIDGMEEEEDERGVREMRVSGRNNWGMSSTVCYVHTM